MSGANKTTTRAKAAGVSAAAYARKADEFVSATRKRLQQIAYEWEEVDSSVDYAATTLERELDAFDQHVKDCVERLRQPVDQE